MNEIERLAECDWVHNYSPHMERLHHLAGFDDPDRANSEWRGAGVTTCGLRDDLWAIPGLLMRMDMRRCGNCCRILGIPAGVGSPKNDERLKGWLKERIEPHDS